MTRSSILGGEHAAEQASGRDTDALGPSDSSDSGSDVQGETARATPDEPDLQGGAMPARQDSDSDAAGTGERATAIDADAELDADILPDRIDGPDGLGADAEPFEPAAADALVADPRYHEDDSGLEDDDEDAAVDDAVDKR